MKKKSIIPHLDNLNNDPCGRKCDHFLSFRGFWVYMQHARPLPPEFSSPEWDVVVIVCPYLVVNQSS